MKLYIASHDVIAAQVCGRYLRQEGYTITSRWHDDPRLYRDALSDSEAMRMAVIDVQDVKEAEILVLLSGCDRYTGGKFVEAGIALGQGKPVVVVGRRENVPLHHPAVSLVGDVVQLANFLGLLRRAMPEEIMATE